MIGFSIHVALLQLGLELLQKLLYINGISGNEQKQLDVHNELDKLFLQYIWCASCVSPLMNEWGGGVEMDLSTLFFTHQKDGGIINKKQGRFLRC